MKDDPREPWAKIIMLKGPLFDDSPEEAKARKSYGEAVAQAYARQRCHDCGAAEGELHRLGCDMERCPVCGRQAISCFEHFFTSETGVSKDMMRHRVPYIITPHVCRRCLAPWPPMFRVEDEEWEANVPVGLRHEMLCPECYLLVAGWMRAARGERDE